MKRQNNDFNSEKFSWFDCIDDIDEEDQEVFDAAFQVSPPSKEQSQFLNANILTRQQLSIEQKQPKDQKQQQVNLQYLKHQPTTQIAQSDVNAIFQEIQQPKNIIKQQYQQFSDINPLTKQTNYSKTYRERKKQYYKHLQQQNKYLKKRIQDLQYRLRQKQIQLNRFKYPPPEKQLSFDQFRKQFQEKTQFFVKRQKSLPIQQAKIAYKPNEFYYQQLTEHYNMNGFAGSKKFNIIHYHFEEICQALLLDSQRYLTLVFMNSKGPQKLQPLQQYDVINKAFLQVFRLNGEFNKRLQYFVDNLHPMLLEFTENCSLFYKSFQNIQSCANKIHAFLRQTYLSNMDVARKRMQLETWFSFHKYGKLIRTLKAQWLNLIKQGFQNTKKQNKKDKQSKRQRKIEEVPLH